ncbi:uncharacterized protein Z520_02180 [Fonsecaea multimorphosa CBS 102226]|uniref:Uncharacterized protein n=1 Tax=Fonsecaea multimorphosa CBS 102226 TaxID=1442371 RepID=A0A0D2IYB4_9EURO|nr:uncharacterized protein Z520_02180 [Fonsecaea multimorphosa CBS 102226]KIY02042.1 hypothetical protein Z520_02180 [Fonsecaea multimorphosa CBS 102226]OAL29242.1 hypothetical protein AYO22_02136 [Fonsecaea multimorphosa]
MSSFTGSVLVTGGTTGLGFHAAAEIARQRPDHCIVIAARTDAGGSAESINRRVLGSEDHDHHRRRVQFMVLDLGDLKSVRAFVARWAEQNLPPISILLLNAGRQFPFGDIQYTADGFEATFGINHMGHALLFYLLQPHLANEARIVVTASGTHDPLQKTGMPPPMYTSAEDLAHPASPAALKAPGRQRYTSSKLCNVLWTYALDRRLGRPPSRQKWTVVAFDPGLMPGTGLARGYPAVARFMWKRVLPSLIPLLRLVLSSPNIHTPEESGAALAWLALDAEVRMQSGVYFEGRRQIKSSVDSYDETKQEELWAWTVKTLARDEQERRRFELVET